MQEQFDITIDEDEMMPDNFESVNAIVAFVAAKRKSVAA
jgi:acyl carrier protein